MGARTKRIAICIAVVLVAAGAGASAGNVIVGSIEKIDVATKTVAVKTVDGTVEAVRFTDRTTVRGVKGVVRVTDLAAGSTNHFVVHYTETGGHKVATGLEFVGDGAWKTTKGVVIGIDRSGRTVAVKTADGAEWTFHASERAVVDTGRGIEVFADDVGQGVAKGAEVTVHYSEEGGKKVGHFFVAVGRHL